MIIQWATKGGGQWSRTCSLNSLSLLSFLPRPRYPLSVPVPLGQPLTTLTTLPSLSLPPIGHDASRLLGGRLPLATMHNTPVHLSISLRILSPLPICLVVRPIIVYIPTREIRLNSSVATKIEKEIQRDGFYGNTIDVKMRLCNTERSEGNVNLRVSIAYIYLV